MALTDYTGLLTGAGQLGTAILPYVLSEGEIGTLRDLGTQAQTQAGTIAQQASGAAAFQPFAVKTATGAGTTIAAPTEPGGLPTLQYSLSPEEQALQTSLLSGASTMAGATPTTAESLYGQIRAMQTPEEQRQQLALENRLAAQGRLGVQTAAYGGTPEQLAYQKAVQEAQNAAAFQAAQLAPALQQQNIANVTGMLGAAYLPQQQAMAGLMPAIDISRISQAARQGQAEALYRGGIAGLEAQAAAGTAAANVEAARTQALANALTGMFAQPASGGASAGESFISNLLGYFSPPTTFSDSSGITGTVLDSGMLISDALTPEDQASPF